MPSASHLVLLVEEPSMEAFLQALLPRVLPQDCTFEAHPFQGKDDLISKLEARLRAYAQWLPDDWRIFVIVDRDDEDCKDLKARLEMVSARAGLKSRTVALKSGADKWQLINRIAIEELEAWYFGDWEAVRAVFPRVPIGIPQSKGFRNPDAILGGTWEQFERVLQRYGYCKAGLTKIETARAIGERLDPSKNRSASFLALHTALAEAIK